MTAIVVPSREAGIHDLLSPEDIAGAQARDDARRMAKPSRRWVIRIKVPESARRAAKRIKLTAQSVAHVFMRVGAWFWDKTVVRLIALSAIFVAGYVVGLGLSLAIGLLVALPLAYLGFALMAEIAFWFVYLVCCVLTGIALGWGFSTMWDNWISPVF